MTCRSEVNIEKWIGPLASAEPIIDELKRNGAICRNEEVIQAERIIAANGPNASAAFGQRIIEELKSEFTE
jgi:putative intracellular protease/amidase